MVLDKLLVPGGPTNLDNSRAMAYSSCSRCGRGLSEHFFAHLSFLSSFFRSLEDGPIYAEIQSPKAVKPRTTNGSIIWR